MNGTDNLVGGVFRPDGLFLTLVEKGAILTRLVTWKELEKLARNGDKMTKSAAIKSFAKSADKLVKSNKEAIAQSEKRAAESRKMLKELQVQRLSPMTQMRPKVVATPEPPQA